MVNDYIGFGVDYRVCCCGEITMHRQLFVCASSALVCGGGVGGVGEWIITGV